MNFDLTDELKMIRDPARDFADEVIAPCHKETDQIVNGTSDVQRMLIGRMLTRLPSFYVAIEASFQH